MRSKGFTESLDPFQFHHQLVERETGRKRSVIMGSSAKMINGGTNGSSLHHHHQKRGGGGSARSYGLMLLLAFGAAILGVMILHKLREGRLFSLLVKEKETELLSLNFLLQKEREFHKEARKKIEELIAQANTLRNENMEASHKLSGMNYMVASMREDQKALESELEEKKKEIEKLRSEANTAKADQEKQQQQQQQSGVVTQKVWSVSSDDPSNMLTVDQQSRTGELRRSDEENLRGQSADSGNKTSTQDRPNEEAQGRETNSAQVRRESEETTADSEMGSFRGGKWRDVISARLQKNGYSEEENVMENEEEGRHGGDATKTEDGNHHLTKQNSSLRGSRWKGVISTRLQKSGYSEDDGEVDVVSAKKRLRKRFLHILKARKKNHANAGHTTSTSAQEIQQSEHLRASDQDRRSSSQDEQQQQMHNVTERGEQSGKQEGFVEKGQKEDSSTDKEQSREQKIEEISKQDPESSEAAAHANDRDTANGSEDLIDAHDHYNQNKG